MFKLEDAIQRWVRKFKQHRAFDEAAIREMEIHLRDHIDDLMGEGMSSEQAFITASREFGEVSQMAEEEFQGVQQRTGFMNLHLYRNYLLMSIRRITRQPFLTFLNTFGLAVGMAGALLIGLYIYDELSFDQMFSYSDRIYRINIENQTKGEYKEYASAPGPMASVILQDCPAVESVTRFREVGSILLKKPGEKKNIKETHVAGADSIFLQMFGGSLLEGDPKALHEPNSLVLTRSAVKKHFGEDGALGKHLVLDNEEVYEVTGIINDFPKNSFLRNHTVFISMESFDDAQTKAWNTWYFPTFVKLHANSSPEALQTFLDTVKENYLIPWAMTFVPGLTLEGMRASEEESGDFMRFNSTLLTDIRLHSSSKEGEFSENSEIRNVYILGGIGFFLLLMASVNFMNLATAHSLKRAREVGIRKTLGSGRAGLIRQFLTESLLTAFLSFLLAMVIAVLVLPLFNTLAAKTLVIPFNDPVFWFIMLLLVFVLGLLSGSYPSLFLSRFVPAKSLKGDEVKGGAIRNLLIVVQFSISVFLIVGSIVVFQQVKYIQHKDLGFKKDQILIIEDVAAAGNQVSSMKTNMEALSQVENVSLSSYLPTPSKRSGTTFFTEGSFENGKFVSDQALIIETWDIDTEYISILDLQMVAGRNFSENNPADSGAVILNETAVSMLEVTPREVIGMRLTEDFHRPDKENMKFLTVIGVVKNFHFESMRNSIKALSLTMGGKPEKMIVKLSTDNLTETIGEIEEIWNKHAEDQTFTYYFMDDSFNSTYQAELRLGTIFLTFTILAIIIACLGLFGLAAFSAEKRSKEIGIRKVLGASVKQITFQLTREFLKLVCIAIAVALPISWFAMVRWLEGFSFRIEIRPWMLVTAALLAILICIVTVSYQSIRAAMANPVKRLRSE